MLPTFPRIIYITQDMVERNAHTGVDIEAINYTTKFTSKMKAKFPTVTKSSLMSLYLDQEYQNSSVLLTTNC